MDFTRAALIVVITLAVVILINLAIYAIVANKRNIGEIELLRKAAQRARAPWEDEDKNLQELSRIVSGLRKDADQNDSSNGKEDPM